MIKKMAVIYKGEEYYTDGLLLMSDPPQYALYKDGQFVTYALQNEVSIKEIKLYED
jgi:hypothetical protein